VRRPFFTSDCRRSRAPPHLRQADQARDDFAVILDELDFVKAQLGGLPTRAEVKRIVLRATLGALAAIVAVALLLGRWGAAGHASNRI
jgi:hypothetical protein